MKTCPRCHLRYPSDATKCFVDGETLVAMQDPRIGLVLSGRYEIERVLAEGGVATVYVARHRVVKRACAVKILSSGLGRNQVVRERFRREAKATQKLAHPNIIEILDHGETDDGLPYLVMEYLEGETLADVIARGALTMPQAMPIALQIARALARAHDFDVIHRDLKPDNVFLCAREGTSPLAKLLDFGIARSMHDARLTSAGEVFGTPQYMAPERISTIDAGPSADLYSFGVMLFEMLTGKLPFQASDVASYFSQHIKETPPTVASMGVSVPPSLEALIASLLEKTADKRPVDAHAVCKELLEISAKARIAVPPEPRVEQVFPEEEAKSLPSTTTDRWAQRTLVFEQMLAKAHGGNQPPEAKELLATIQRKVRELSVLRSDAIKEQRMLSALEGKSKEGRQRFGNAVEGLGLDASKARKEARDAREQAEKASIRTDTLRKQAMALHREVILWEGRSAFEEPYSQLADAYRRLADAIDPWFAARKLDLEASKKAVELENVVTDLEFQIGELRAGLLRLETSSEKEREAIEQRSTELSQKADSLEQELLSLASRFCEPLRAFPAVSALFRQLETGSS
ncbi:MAG TPA: protein kinase [Polyangiaceae bacterium]|nr:protein kinase [Polyangiaceae bacterium]